MRVVKSRVFVTAVACIVAMSVATISHAQAVGAPGVSNGNRLIALGSPATTPSTSVPSLPVFGTPLGSLGWSYSVVLSGLWSWQPGVSVPRTSLRPSAHAVRERRSTR